MIINTSRIEEKNLQGLWYKTHAHNYSTNEELIKIEPDHIYNYGERIFYFQKLDLSSMKKLDSWDVLWNFEYTLLKMGVLERGHKIGYIAMRNKFLRGLGMMT